MNCTANLNDSYTTPRRNGNAILHRAVLQREVNSRTISNITAGRLPYFQSDLDSGRTALPYLVRRDNSGRSSGNDINNDPSHEESMPSFFATAVQPRAIWFDPLPLASSDLQPSETRDALDNTKCQKQVLINIIENALSILGEDCDDDDSLMATPASTDRQGRGAEQ